MAKKSSMSRKQTQSPGDGFESACCCQQHILQSLCAVPCPSLQSRAVLEAKSIPCPLLGTRRGCHHLPLQQTLLEVPCSEPPASLFFCTAGRAPASCEYRRVTLTALYCRRNMKIAPSYIQDISVFVINSLLFSFPYYAFTGILPAFFFFSCHFSVLLLLLLFQFSPFSSLSLLPTAFFTHFSFYLHIFPSFFPYPFCFCSLIIFFLPVLSSVLYFHPSTPSLPLIILLFVAAVSFNAFFDTAYSLMIIRKSGDAGAMNFTNPALRASVHNHSSRSTGTES